MTDKPEFNPTLVSCAEDMSTCTLTLGDGKGYFYNRVDADPVPPAGGEPEVVAWRSSDTFGAVYAYEPDRPTDEYHGLVTLESHRAHVTRLQAEVADVSKSYEALAHVYAATQKGFEKMQAEVERLTEQLHTRTADLLACGTARKILQSELTKARELLTRITGPSLQDQGRAIGEAVTFLSNQSAPADKPTRAERVEHLNQEIATLLAQDDLANAIFDALDGSCDEGTMYSLQAELKALDPAEKKSLLEGLLERAKAEGNLKPFSDKLIAFLSHKDVKCCDRYPDCVCHEGADGL